ncbi:hypothetical protein [Blastopirellula retiformator]|uniref:Uncharacterized protein n=1 Tax=Blastopirellula retiformator TaxID=2527970 RepID=A0A5C5V704_9BACT|nr:hypothetical protein [Blastopirellula retiformator]TWT34306.1 hypothetical protein Enr8_17000 [Blastopirellula retiformator]
MTTTTKNILTLIAVATIVVAFSTQTEAGGCHSKGGGYGFKSNYTPSHFNHYQKKNYSSYRQPIYHHQPRFVSTPPNPAPQPFPQQQQPAQQPQVQQQAPAAQPQQQAPVNAETSALEALGGFAPPAAQPEASQPVVTTPVATNDLPEHVGRWSANLANGAKIQLDLNANGSFSWSAINKSGSTSSFQGTYEINSGSLTLIRSTDNQKLAGSLQTSGANAFSFQLADNNAAKLQFVRA